MSYPIHRRFSGQSGVTLAELLVVIVVIAVMSAFALMQRGSANEQFKRQNVARELKVAFERGRFDSVKRRALRDSTPDNPYSPTDDIRARVLITESSYTLVTDNNTNGDLVNDDGTFDPADVRATSFGGQNIVIAGYGSLSLPYTIYYNRRGDAVDSGGASINPAFLVCNVSCTSPTVANSNIVLVTPTGTVNLLAGGTAIPSFTAPNVSVVPGTNSVSNMVYVPTP